MNGRPEIEFEAGPTADCPVCDDPLLVSARVPHQLRREDGHVVDGSRTLGLCARCDRDDPDAQGLLAFFTVHVRAELEDAATLGALLEQWAQSMAGRPGPPAAADAFADIEDEYRQWLADDSRGLRAYPRWQWRR